MNLLLRLFYAIEHFLALRLALGLRSRRVRTSLCRFHVVDAPGKGNGPPVVLLHGVGGRKGEFAPVIGGLRKVTTRVIAPDLPGHGLSSPLAQVDGDTMLEALVELFDRLLPGQSFFLVGNSLGGGAAMRYSLAHPDRVLGMVLVAPAGAPMSPEVLSETLGKFDVKSLTDARRLVDLLFERYSLIMRTWPVLWLIKHNFNSRSVRGFIDSLTTNDLLTEAQLRELREPIHVIWNRHDRVLPIRNLELMQANMADSATFSWIEDSGHCPHFDAADELGERITGWIHEHIDAGAGR